MIELEAEVRLTKVDNRLLHVDGITKAQLIDYDASMAEVVLPYMGERLLARMRRKRPL
ncbi:MAG TPA: hypothetical protein VF157_10345 [Chloroflexota bacterium]